MCLRRYFDLFKVFLIVVGIFLLLFGFCRVVIKVFLLFLDLDFAEWVLMFFYCFWDLLIAIWILQSEMVFNYGIR
jgi:hypothetical protein